MKIGTTALSLVTALALTSAPLASASARGWDHWHHHGGGFVGPGVVVGGVVGAAVALATAPFAILGAIAGPPEPVAAPAPVYAAPAPVAYGYPGYYGYPHRRVVVAYGYPAPAYAYPAYSYPGYPY